MDFDRRLAVREHARERYSRATRDGREVLLELARFGVAKASDLDRRILQDLRRRGAVWVGSAFDGTRRQIVQLTDKGKKDAKRLGGESIAVRRYVEPKRLSHDAGVYSMYLQARAEIEKSGGLVVRARVENEFQRDLRKDPTLSWRSVEARARFAREHGLKIVNGRLCIPDVRLYFRDARGRDDHRDLELASGPRSAVAVKVKRSAGMKIYHRVTGIKRPTTYLGNLDRLVGPRR